MFAEAGAGGDEVEHLDDLGAEAAGELAGAAEGVLAGDPALLVGGCSEREVAVPEESVVGDHAVTGGEDVGEVGAHLPVDDDRSPASELGAGVGRELTVGACPDRHEHKVSREPQRIASRSLGADLEAVGVSRLQLLDRVDAGVACHVDAVLVELGADECAELGVDGWEHFRELLDLGHGDAACDERLGHLESDVSGADDHRSSDVLLFEGLHEGEGVSH